VETVCHADESSAAGTIVPVRAVMLEVPHGLPDERRARELDRWDGMWGAELHVVPPSSGGHRAAGAERLLVEPVRIRALDVRAGTVDGGLRLTWDGGTADI
jgi:hypothetical protein